jgi:hypothetical protein
VIGSVGASRPTRYSRDVEDHELSLEGACEICRDRGRLLGRFAAARCQQHPGGLRSLRRRGGRSDGVVHSRCDWERSGDRALSRCSRR